MKGTVLKCLNFAKVLALSFIHHFYLLELHNILSKSEFLLLSDYSRASHISSNADIVGAGGCFLISIENETLNNVL